MGPFRRLFNGVIMAIEKSKTNGRDSSGKFAVGNTYGRGRPRKEVEASYLRAFNDGCPPDQFRRIVARMAKLAEGGNIAAARLILSHAMPGKELRIELASDDREFRVAGETPRESLEHMQTYIAERVQQMRKSEPERNKS